MHSMNIKKLLALITLAGFFAILVALFFVNIPKDNLDLAKTMVIALIAVVSTVAGYYFGSSEGSARKTELMTPPPFMGVDLAASDGDKTVTAIVKNDAGYIRIVPLLAIFIIIGIMFISLVGCAHTSATGTTDTPLQTAGKSLLAVKSSIVVAATATDSLCANGKLPAYTCAQAKAAYEMSKPAYDMAVDAYLLYSSGGDAADYTAALVRVQGIAQNLLLIASGGAK